MVDRFLAAPQPRIVLDIVDDQRGVVQQLRQDEDRIATGPGILAPARRAAGAKTRPATACHHDAAGPTAARTASGYTTPAGIHSGARRSVEHLAPRPFGGRNVASAESTISAQPLEIPRQVEYVAGALDLQASAARHRPPAHAALHPSRALPNRALRPEHFDLLIVRHRSEQQLRIQPRMVIRKSTGYRTRDDALVHRRTGSTRTTGTSASFL